MENSSEILVFFGGRDVHPEFSQWFQASFVEDGITFQNCEQYMMYHKAMLFGDTDTASTILKTRNAAKIKSLGRKAKGFVQSVWEEKRYEIVRNGNYLKFSQNPELKQLLLATGEQVIAEGNGHDPIWGIGLFPSNPDCQDPTKWNGLNLLGQALMDVRTQLRQ
ncbi:putative N-glycosidase R617 [Blattamonas nauphoetae]|uniref:N-glycosidase R617 n=1 Tax=Blattamonas nauphoetae TaxID=2049346 RepID=A0ABQ9YLG9_9EUKA|nr:putative N-glycosidase R617 [Blattamonas nauphoetae]